MSTRVDFSRDLTRNYGSNPPNLVITIADQAARAMQQQFGVQQSHQQPHQQHVQQPFQQQQQPQHQNTITFAPATHSSNPPPTSHDNPIVIDDLTGNSGALTRGNSIGHPALLLVEELQARLRDTFAHYNSPNFVHGHPVVKVESHDDANFPRPNTSQGAHQVPITSLPVHVLNFDALSAMMAISDVAVAAQRYADTARRQQSQVEGLSVEDIEKQTASQQAEDSNFDNGGGNASALLGGVTQTDDPSPYASGRPSLSTQNPIAPGRGRGRVDAAIRECQAAIDKIKVLGNVELRMQDAHGSSQSSQQAARQAQSEVQNAINSAKHTVNTFHESVTSAVDAERTSVERIIANFQSNAQCQFEKIVNTRLGLKQSALSEIRQAYEKFSNISKAKIAELKDKQQRLATIDDYDPSYEMVRGDCMRILTLIDVTKTDLLSFLRLAESLATCFNGPIADIVLQSNAIREVIGALDMAAQQWHSYDRDQAMSCMSDMFSAPQQQQHQQQPAPTMNDIQQGSNQNTINNSNSVVPISNGQVQTLSAPPNMGSAFQPVLNNPMSSVDSGAGMSAPQNSFVSAPVPSGRRNPGGQKRGRSNEPDDFVDVDSPQQDNTAVIRIAPLTVSAIPTSTTNPTTASNSGSPNGPARSYAAISTTNANIAAVIGGNSHHNNAGWEGGGWVQHPQVVVSQPQRPWGSNNTALISNSTTTSAPTPVLQQPLPDNGSNVQPPTNQAPQPVVTALDDDPTDAPTSKNPNDTKGGGGGFFSAMASFFSSSSGMRAYVSDDEFAEEGQFAPDPPNRHRRRAE
eukprot:GILI01006515.1.p1 GENE.GILI01006515.1~~GILI01006515.1.p1  ORF type:complete len:802 (+),score=175.80 GILI01006515.1:55-2460(+)